MCPKLYVHLPKNVNKYTFIYLFISLYSVDWDTLFGDELPIETGVLKKYVRREPKWWRLFPLPIEENRGK